MSNLRYVLPKFACVSVDLQAFIQLHGVKVAFNFYFCALVELGAVLPVKLNVIIAKIASRQTVLDMDPLI